MKTLAFTFWTLATISAVVVCGCSTQGSQPAKAQTQTFNKCQFTFNNIPATGDLLTQNQSLESSGQENFAQAPSNPFTVSPQTTATLTRPAVAPDAISSLANGVSSVIKSIVSDKPKATETNGANACADGSCVDDCPDGNCSIK